MAKITKIDPSKFDDAKVVQVDVDAGDNWQAIDAMEGWASSHGFARVRENFLRVIIKPNGKRVFRGECYRLTKEEKVAIDLLSGEIIGAAGKIGRSVKSGK